MLIIIYSCGVVILSHGSLKGLLFVIRVYAFLLLVLLSFVALFSVSFIIVIFVYEEDKCGFFFIIRNTPCKKKIGDPFKWLNTIFDKIFWTWLVWLAHHLPLANLVEWNETLFYSLFTIWYFFIKRIVHLFVSFSFTSQGFLDEGMYAIGSQPMCAYVFLIIVLKLFLWSCRS